MDKIHKIRYYAIMADLTTVIYEDVSKAINSGPYKIMKEIEGIWINGEYRNTAYEYEIFDENGKEIHILGEGNWKLSNLSIGSNIHYNRVTVHFDLTGPKGRVIESKFFGVKNKGIIKALKFLRDVTKFESVQSYQLFEENQRLKKQIKKMKEKN